MNETPPGFSRDLISAFRYPFQGDGAYVIVGGAVFFTAADFVSGYASIGGIFIQLAVSGFVAAYAKDVVRTSAMGEDAPPPWADFSDWMEDLLVPALQFLFVAALTFGGLIFLQFKMPVHGVWEKILPVIVGGWGCLAFPILFLAVAMMDSALAAVNVLPLLRAVAATLPSYLLTVGFFALLLGLSIGLGILLSFAGRIPILPDLVGWLLDLFLLTVMMRGIGLYYRFNHEKLEWY